MSDDFDPYYSWLGIPPQEQPADHYRLLGIARYEDNAEVIENAVDRQMAHLRTHQLGKHAELSQTLLNEVAASKSLDQLCETATAGGGSLPSVGSSAGWSYMRLPASDGPALEWSSPGNYVDHWCVGCNGLGSVECPNRGCSRGTVRAYRMETTGVNPVTGAKIMRKVAIRVPCGVCGGHGRVACPTCSGSGKN